MLYNNAVCCLSCVTFTRYFPSRVLLTVSLCLVHAGVPTSLNSVATSLRPSVKASLRRRLLLNAVYRLLLNVSDASLSFLPRSSRASCTSEPSCLHHHTLDLALVHPTAAQLGPCINFFWTLLWILLHLLNHLHLSLHLCTLHGVLLTPLASLALSEY